MNIVLRTKADCRAQNFKSSNFIKKPIPRISNLKIEPDSFQLQNKADTIAFSGLISTESAFKKERRLYNPFLAKAFSNIKALKITEGKTLEAAGNEKEIMQLFPNTYGQGLVIFNKKTKIEQLSELLSHSNIKNTEFSENKIKKVAVVLSGGQAAGGHNVISGLYDALKSLDPRHTLIGAKHGPDGLINNDFINLTDSIIDKYRNTGGFDMLESGRTKIESEDQFKKVLDNCKKNEINSIVIIGGDDSNTNAAFLAEKFKNEGIQVIGCPKTIDGDLKTKDIETSFGFDSATKVYANIVSNIQTDAISAKKYWHFIKIMGRSASNVALEVSLKTHPTLTLISEEIAKNEMSLDNVINSIAIPIAERAKQGKQYGTIIIPEGLIEFIPETKNLLEKMNEVISLCVKEGIDFNKLTTNEKKKLINDRFTSQKLEQEFNTFNNLPSSLQTELVQKRDPHGNLPVSQVKTEEFLAKLVQNKLKKLNNEHPDYKNKIKFNALHHFLGYEGRCVAPSNFDSNYCYNLGHTAAALLDTGKTGYMAGVKNLSKKHDEWQPIGVPITSLLNLEPRNGKPKAVIKKALVDIDGDAFKTFQKLRNEWIKSDSRTGISGIQYSGTKETTEEVPITLLFDQCQAKQPYEI